MSKFEAEKETLLQRKSTTLMNQSKEVKKLQNQIQDLKAEKEKMLEEKMK